MFPIGVFSPGCDLGLMISKYDLIVNETFSLKFRGPQIINATISALIDNGSGPLANAQSVLLTGVTFGGMAVVLAADLVHEELQRSLPTLQTFKVLPVDAIHPRYYSMVWMAWNNFFSDSWMTSAFQFLANVTSNSFNNTPASLPLQSCTINGTIPLYECLYLNASLPYVTSPMFLVQQLSAVWDNQCMYEGAAPTDNLMQVECSKASSIYKHYYTCVQYPDLCDSFIVANFSIPLQQVYSSYANTSIITSSQSIENGYFLHSCYLGVYSMSGRGNTSVWNIITINGITMREAISAWWTGTNITLNKMDTTETTNSMLHHDCYWNASGIPPLLDIDKDTTTMKDTYQTYTSSNFQKSSEGLDAPIVPPWTSRYFCNPTCRGFPWY